MTFVTVRIQETGAIDFEVISVGKSLIKNDRKVKRIGWLKDILIGIMMRFDVLIYSVHFHVFR